MLDSREETLTTQNTRQSTSKSQLAGDSDDTGTDVHLKHSLRTLANCSSPYASIFVVTNNDRDILLSFSSFKTNDVRFMTSLTCYIHLTSPPSSVISAVLLEHSVCSAGGVFVLLWDNTTRTSWDVCSAWETPGPDIVTSSTTAGISIELSDVLYPFDLNISIGATDRSVQGQLELRFISATEGNLLMSPCFSLFIPTQTPSLFVC